MSDIPMELPAESAGLARIDNGVIDVGGVRIFTGHGPGWKDVPVYIRRISSDLRVAEIIIPFHDGLEQEVLDNENFEADRYPLGPKEYWRSMAVGKWDYGADQHPMTEAEFEEFWDEDFG